MVITKNTTSTDIGRNSILSTSIKGCFVSLPSLFLWSLIVARAGALRGKKMVEYNSSAASRNDRKARVNETGEEGHTES